MGARRHKQHSREGSGRQHRLPIWWHSYGWRDTIPPFNVMSASDYLLTCYPHAFIFQKDLAAVLLQLLLCKQRFGKQRQKSQDKGIGSRQGPHHSLTLSDQPMVFLEGYYTCFIRNNIDKQHPGKILPWVTFGQECGHFMNSSFHWNLSLSWKWQELSLRGAQRQKWRQTKKLPALSGNYITKCNVFQEIMKLIISNCKATKARSGANEEISLRQAIRCASYIVLIFNNLIMIFACMCMCFLCCLCSSAVLLLFEYFFCFYQASLQNLWHSFILHLKLESLILFNTYYLNKAVVCHLFKIVKSWLEFRELYTCELVLFSQGLHRQTFTLVKFIIFCYNTSFPYFPVAKYR